VYDVTSLVTIFSNAGCRLVCKTFTSCTLASLLFHSLSEKNVCGEVDGEMNAIEAMQSRLLAMESEMDNLRNIIHCCSIPFQQGNVCREKLQSLSDGLKVLGTQLKFLLDSWPRSFLQYPLMQQLYERRQAALEYYRKKFGQETRNIHAI